MRGTTSLMAVLVIAMLVSGFAIAAPVLAHSGRGGDSDDDSSGSDSDRSDNSGPGSMNSDRDDDEDRRGDNSGPGSMSSGSGSGDETRLRAELLDSTGGDFGKADFRDRGDRMKLSVEAENLDDLGVAEGDILSVFIGSSGVGDVTVAADADISDGLSFDLNLDTDDGETVPAVAVGDVVEVRNSAGTVILSGTFAVKGEQQDEDETEQEIEEEIQGNTIEIEVERDGKKVEVEVRGVEPSMVDSIREMIMQLIESILGS